MEIQSLSSSIQVSAINSAALRQLMLAEILEQLPYDLGQCMDMARSMATVEVDRWLAHAMSGDPSRVWDAMSPAAGQIAAKVIKHVRAERQHTHLMAARAAGLLGGAMMTLLDTVLTAPSEQALREQLEQELWLLLMQPDRQTALSFSLRDGVWYVENASGTSIRADQIQLMRTRILPDGSVESILIEAPQPDFSNGTPRLGWTQRHVYASDDELSSSESVSMSAAESFYRDVSAKEFRELMGGMMPPVEASHMPNTVKPSSGLEAIEDRVLPAHWMVH